MMAATLSNYGDNLFPTNDPPSRGNEDLNGMGSRS